MGPVARIQPVADGRQILGAEAKLSLLLGDVHLHQDRNPAPCCRGPLVDLVKQGHLVHGVNQAHKRSDVFDLVAL